MSVLKSAPFRAVLGLAVAAGLIFAVGAVDEDPADAEGGTAAVQDGPVLGDDIVSVSDLNIVTFGKWMDKIGKDNCDQTRAGYVCQNLVYANPGDTSPTWSAALYLSGSGLPGRSILTKIRVDHGETFSYESDRSLSQGTYILLTSDELPAGHELEFTLEFSVDRADGVIRGYDFFTDYLPQDDGTYAAYPGYQTIII